MAVLVEAHDRVDDQGGDQRPACAARGGRGDGGGGPPVTQQQCGLLTDRPHESAGRQPGRDDVTPRCLRQRRAHGARPRCEGHGHRGRRPPAAQEQCRSSSSGQGVQDRRGELVAVPRRERRSAGAVDELAAEPSPDGRPGVVPSGDGGVVAHPVASTHQPPDQVDVLPDPHARVEPGAECAGAGHQAGTREPRNGGAGSHGAGGRPEGERGGDDVVPLEPAGSLGAGGPTHARTDEGHGRVGEVPGHGEKVVCGDLHVGVDEGHERRADGSEPDVACRGRAGVDVERDEPGVVASGGVRDRRGLERGVVDHDDPQWWQGGQCPVELAGAVPDRDDDGEVVRVDGRDVAEVGYAEVGGEQPVRQVRRGGVGDGDRSRAEQLPSPPGQSHRGQRGAADQEAAVGRR